MEFSVLQINGTTSTLPPTIFSYGPCYKVIFISVLLILKKKNPI
uniref:Uncharacterized protein n=1 Tax=Arundo donax TaxID=35708 RepID=A0A0A9B026_ARUDO